jgi:DNA topoisomerase-1
MKLALSLLMILLSVPSQAGFASGEGECDALLLSASKGEQIARSVGLHYVSPGGPGITRRGGPATGFRYLDSSGKVITDSATLQRIEDLKIPPGYKNVWISEDPDAHIQATAEDAKGRIQYRYHPKWIAAKAEVKFSRMIQFGESLKSIHKAEDADLALSGLPKNKMLAGLAKIMELTSIRVGNARYAVENESFGLTTLLNDQKQVVVSGNTIHFSFKGKSGVFHEFDVNDRKLAQIAKQSLALKQPQAFDYISDDGSAHSIDSLDLNDYLKRISGGSFSAKDFRTWGGTTFTAKFLMDAPVPKTSEEAEKNISNAIEYAASRLGNTPAVCRSNYVDPRLIEDYMSGTFTKAANQLQRSGASSDGDSLKPEEQIVLDLLEAR